VKYFKYLLADFPAKGFFASKKDDYFGSRNIHAGILQELKFAVNENRTHPYEGPDIIGSSQ